jgi:UDP-glucose 4-epimerase
LDPRNEVKIAFSDHRKAERIFGRHEKTGLQEGISAMAEWVKKYGARESGFFKNIEVMKNMPPSWASMAERKRKILDV